MLGLQETRSAGTPSTKTYNCVACSATFNGLASLLVHQASHASEISDHKVSALPTCSHCSGLFASKELLDKHQCMVLPPPVAPDVHKKEHEINTQVKPQVGEPSITNSEAELEDSLKTACSHDAPVEVPSQETITQEHMDVGLQPSDSPTCIPILDLPPVQDIVAQEHIEELQLLDPSTCIPNLDLPPVKETVTTEHLDDGLQSCNPSACIPISDVPPVQETITQKHMDDMLQPFDPSACVPISDLPPVQDTVAPEHIEELQLLDPSTCLPILDLPPVKETITTEHLDDGLQPSDPPACIPVSDLTPAQDTITQEHLDDGLQSSEPSIPETLAVGDQSFASEAKKIKLENLSNHSDSEESANESERSDSKKSLLKMLASAYLNRRPPAQIQLEQSKRTLPPRKVSPRAPIQNPAVISTSSSSNFMDQLRQKMAKFGPNREGVKQAGGIGKVKPKKKKLKRIISTTKILYPIVALESCQKSLQDNMEGRHQCGVCSRVFQDVDSLIMHHALHKKERVKFCRRCRQYLICVISVPNNHVCSISNIGPSRHFTFVRKSFLTSNNPTMLHSRKMFHCTMCNRSYTRRHSLNKHNCQWIASLKSSATAAKQAENFHSLGEGSSAGKGLVSSEQISVGVNTGKLQIVKSEDLRADFPNKETRLVQKPSPVKSNIHSGSAKSFPPFLANVSKINSAKLNVNFNSAGPTSSRLRERNIRKGSESELDESQWTVPLDDNEIEVMDVDEGKRDSVVAPKNNSDDDVILEPTVKSQPSLLLSGREFQVHISEKGVKRFSCNRCNRSYSRHFTVQQHLKICSARKLREQHSFGKAGILALKKKFPCPLCSASFTRKDRMNMHRKRCQAMRNPTMLAGNRMLEKKNEAPQGNMFVLPPAAKNDVRQDNNKTSAGSGNWGIMSLPSVLPRKVTCECGAVFTCPRLLFEHLQLHAMESYICSHCGENLKSWAELEAHQKLHTQAQVQPQQKQQFQTSSQSVKSQPQDVLKSPLSNRPLPEGSVCHRCKKIFRTRKSMLRHLRLSCRGEIAVQKNHTCSRCGMTFQSQLAHKVHVQSNSCTPSYKPIRCPVCVRWFSSVDGLKKHLLTHSQQKVLTCQICRHKCSSHEDLEEHKRNIHGPKKASASPTLQSAHVSQSNPSNAFRCQICQRTYPKLQSLKDHLRKVHRPQGINMVNLSALQPKAGGLPSSAAMVQQSQSKQLQCTICARTYPDIQSLRNHRRRVHRILGSGLQPSRGPVQQSHFSQFQCHICSRSYPDMRSLRNHRRRVHRLLGGLEMFKGTLVQSLDNQYKCHICQRSYPDVTSFKNHRRRVHHILGEVPDTAKMAAPDIVELKEEPEMLPVISLDGPQTR
ncbi:zinc finger protein 423-like [Astyanax mexicanus]|uniref:Zinc finger protein 423-like n=1 Tax=Astyanax mexicanus TaxID=7994 RepID=A0A8T2LVG2_ASTMX|nr:zinc finger protein 423-like [Astyanax mexicanus]